MIEQDTIRLLRECDAGVKMGIASIDDVLDYVKSQNLKDFLIDCKNEHVSLDREIGEELNRFHDDGKDPNPIAKGMSWVKTNMKIMMDESDSTIADLMTDGCNMGIKSIYKYLNQYNSADDMSKSIANRLISAEQELRTDLRSYL